MSYSEVNRTIHFHYRSLADTVLSMHVHYSIHCYFQKEKWKKSYDVVATFLLLVPSFTTIYSYADLV
jgi:hypothetical protein